MKMIKYFKNFKNLKFPGLLYYNEEYIQNYIDIAKLKVRNGCKYIIISTYSQIVISIRCYFLFFSRFFTTKIDMILT
jgi:hypothetical protein